MAFIGDHLHVADVDAAQIRYKEDKLRDWESKYGPVYVHNGFYTSMCALWYGGMDENEQSELQYDLRRLMNDEKEKWNRIPQMTIAGHSLGRVLPIS